MGGPGRPGFYPGRRRGRALGRRAPPAGPGRVDERCWLRAGGVGPGHGSPEPGPKAPTAAGTQPPAARRLSRYDPLFKLAATVMGHPLFKPAVTVVVVVLGVWWGLRWPRRLTVLAIAGEAQAAVITVPWGARAVQRRRPRMAAGYALVVAGSVARLR